MPDVTVGECGGRIREAISAAADLQHLYCVCVYECLYVGLFYSRRAENLLSLDSPLSLFFLLRQR